MKIRSINNQEDSLYHDALDFAGVNDTTSLPHKQFIRSANAWYRKADTWIWEASGTWEFDDSNWTTLPIATQDLVDSQQDYELPSTARKMDRVEVKDSNGDFYPVKPIDKSQITDEALTEYRETNGLPEQYDLMGRSLILYPAPDSGDVTTSSGLKMYVGRDISEFSLSDTSTEPGFDNHFHRIISLGAAYDYCLTNGVEDRKRELRQEIEQLRQEMAKHYGSRHRDMKPKIRPADKQTI